MIKIIASDDHRIFLEGITRLFELVPDFNLLATCQNRDNLLPLIKQNQPDIILMDISMPGMSMDSAIDAMDTHYPNIQLLALTMHSQPTVATSLLSLGLNGYVLKEDAFDDLEHAIRTVIKGEQYISPLLMDSLLAHHNTHFPNAKALSIRENEVLTFASKGHSNKGIARLLDISERTVRFHLSNCCLKLNTHGRTHAVAKALELFLLKV